MVSQVSHGDSWGASNLLTRSRVEAKVGKTYNYWIEPTGGGGEFILDLAGHAGPLDLLELVNTHNARARSRSLKEFKVFLSDTSDGPWEEIVHQTLEDSRQQADPLPVQKFPFSERAAQFVKFNQISYYGHGGGLQYFTLTSGILGKWSFNSPRQKSGLVQTF